MTRANVVSETITDPRRIVLIENSIWSAYCRPNEVQIECREGEVWITQEGDYRDIILHAGQRFRVEKRGLVLVQALATAMIVVTGGRSG